MMPARRYQAVAQTTASRERLLVLLLQRALACLEMAAQSIGDVDAAAVKRADEGLDKAEAIVVELAATLDASKGGALAQQLSDVYAFVCWRIAEARRGRDVAAVNAAVRAFRPIVEAFDAAVAEVGAQHAR